MVEGEQILQQPLLIVFKREKKQQEKLRINKNQKGLLLLNVYVKAKQHCKL